MARALTAAALLAAPLLLPAAAAAGNLFAVDTTADAPDAVSDGACADASGACTLRAAIQEANATPLVDDTIQLPAGRYKLKRVGAGEDAAATGDLDVTSPITILGAGSDATSIEGKKDRVFQVFSSGSLTMSGVTVRKGRLGRKGDVGDEFGGAGLSNNGGLVVLEDVVMEKNKTSDDGAAIANEFGMLFLTDVTLRKNKAGDDAGGIDLDEGDVTLLRVTFERNKAKDEAGAVETEGFSFLFGENVTFARNRAGSAGALNVEQGGTATLANATFWKNRAREGGGGVNNEDASGLSLTNTILDANRPANCSGLVASGSGNLESGSSCGFGMGDQSDVPDMGLGNLADNGGLTKTCALESGSPAIDVGEETACPPTDQRELPRFDVPSVGTTVCDSGAFEFQGP